MHPFKPEWDGQDMLGKVNEETQYAEVQSMVRYLLQHQMISNREAALFMQVVTAAYNKMEPADRVHLIKSLLITLENFS